MAPVVEAMWGAPTSTLDWCESNYAVCEYIAEFWNTITNTVMIGLAVLGIVTAWRARVEQRYVVSHIGLMLVGVGSWCFHGTLRYEMQLLDELPMLYCTAVFIYCIQLPDPKQRHSPALAVGLVAMCAAVTVAYVWLQAPIFHQTCYGSMVLYLTVNCLRAAWQQRHDRQLGSYIVTAVVLFLAAWGLWNIDIYFCKELQDLRAQMGVWAPLLELHGWWHVLTGYSSYLQIVFSTLVQAQRNGQAVAVRTLFPGGLVPYVVDVTYATKVPKHKLG